MTQIQQIPILLPLAVGSVAVFCTVLIHAMPLAGTLWFVRREKSLGHTGRSFWGDTRIVVFVILFAMVAHLIEIALWAVIFLLCGEFTDIGTAYYHSAVNFSTLGYGDVILSPRWRMLGPLEAGNGMLLFGVTTAMAFAVILGLAQERFADLRK
jgi:Ion channel